MQDHTRRRILFSVAVIFFGLIGAWWYSGFSLEFMQFFAAVPAGEGVVLSLQSPKTTVAVGEQFTVNVMMDTRALQVPAVELHLTFPSNLQAISITPGSLLPNVLQAGTVAAGRADIVVASSPTSPAQGSGVIAVITMTATQNGAAVVTFDPSTQAAAQGQTANVVETVNPITITVGSGGTVTPSPTATPVPTATATAAPGAMVSCAPLNQTVAVGSAANLSATGGSGTYQWFAPQGVAGGSASGPATFSVTYSTPGIKKITVESSRVVSGATADDSVACTVTVQ